MTIWNSQKKNYNLIIKLWSWWPKKNFKDFYFVNDPKNVIADESNALKFINDLAFPLCCNTLERLGSFSVDINKQN